MRTLLRQAMLGALPALAAGALIVALGCGGSGHGASGGGSGDTAARNAAIQSAVTQFAALNGPTPDAENQAMLAWFQKDPHFANAAIVDGSVVAHTTDGVTVAMLNNRRPLDDGTRAAPIGATRLAIEMPTPLPARVINNFGGGNVGPTSQIAKMLNAQKYSVSSGTAGTGQLGAVSGPGVFYIDTHGLSMTEDDGKDTYYLMSSDAYDANNSKAYDAGLKSHFYCVMGDKTVVRQPDGSIKVVTSGNYAISDRYASSNWSANTFGKNSFVFINACSSAKTGLFRSVCFAKGASVYAGWSGDVDNDFASKVAPFVFDRLLGANAVNVEADGPQRPFDYSQTAADLPKHGLTADSTGVTLSFAQNAGTDFGLLTPTISYMSVDEQKGELTVNGVFGTEQGKVTVGGTEIAVKSWGFNSLVCDLPPDVSGDTIVEVRQHKSNTVQLTEWKAHFRTLLDPGQGSLQQTGTLDIRFRADVHSHRDNAHDTPNDPVVPFIQERDSTGQFTASGSGVKNGVTATWQGSAALLPMPFNAGSTNLLFCFGSIDAKQKTIDIALEAAATSGMTATQTPPGSTVPLPGSTGKLDGDFAPGQPIPSLHLQLNADFSIAAGVREETDNGTRVRLEWDAIAPTAPPDPKAARSAVKR